MELTERLVRNCMVSDNVEEGLDNLVSEITEDKSSVSLVVKALGDFLTAEDESVRAKAVSFLSAVLTNCPQDKINKQSARVLTIFYCGKLDDTETIIPALKGFIPLVSNASFTSEDAINCIKAIFQHVTMRVHVQSTRFLVFKIIDTLVARYREALKSLGDDFLHGYVDLVEGEKDPRNLLLIFSITRVILIEFDISSRIDDFFNITFCYFPISFRPPPDDPYGITPDVLKVSLRSCLSASPKFGPLAMPLYMEKLSVGSASTKRDVMQTIASCLPVYGPTSLHHHASKLWTALKIEIFQPIDSETADCALQTTQMLIQTLYSEGEDSSLEEAPHGLGKDIVEECLEVLKEPGKSKAKSAIQVLSALVHTTPLITRYAVSKTVSHLVELFRDPEEISNRPATLAALGTIIQAIRDVFTSKDSRGELRSYGTEKPLDLMKDEVLAVSTVGLKSPASIPSALTCLDALVKVPDVLTDEEMGFVVHNVNEVLNALEETDEAIRTATLDVLCSVTFISSKHIERTTLPLLFSSLQDVAPQHEADAGRVKYRRLLVSLSKLCIQPSLFETLVIRLSTKIEMICTRNPLPLIDRETNAAYVHAMLYCLSSVLTAKVGAGHVDIPKYLDSFVPRLYSIIIAGALLSEEDAMTAVATHPRFIQMAAKVVSQITQAVPVTKQQSFADSLFKAWFMGEISAIAEGHQRLPRKTMSFAPFDERANAVQKGVVPLFSAPVVTFHKEVHFPVDDEGSLLSSLLNWSLDNADNEMEAFATIQTVASLLNKHAEEMSVFITAHRDVFWDNMTLKSRSLDTQRRGVRAWSWLSKALVIRNHKQSQDYVDRLFSLFDDPALAWDAAKAIGNIGSGGENILTKKNFAILRALSVQKYFNLMLPRIIAGAQSTDVARRTPYLVALTTLIKSVPKSMYAHEMHKFLPLLLHGLDLPDVDMRTDVIETLYNAARDASTPGAEVQTAISAHAPTLVTMLLKNCSAQEQSTSRLRQAALQCLGTLPHVVRYDILHPFKSQVIRDLGKSLDDPKRDVRKEAVDAIEIWYRYSG